MPKPVKGSLLIEVILQQLAQITEPGGAASVGVADMSSLGDCGAVSASSSAAAAAEPTAQQPVTLQSARSLPPQAHPGQASQPPLGLGAAGAASSSASPLPTQLSTSSAKNAFGVALLSAPRVPGVRRSLRRPGTEPVILSPEAALEACIASTGVVPLVPRVPARHNHGRRTQAMAFRSFAALRNTTAPPERLKPAGPAAASAGGPGAAAALAAVSTGRMKRSESALFATIPPGWAGGGGLGASDCYATPLPPAARGATASAPPHETGTRRDTSNGAWAFPPSSDIAADSADVSDTAAPPSARTSDNSAATMGSRHLSDTNSGVGINHAPAGGMRAPSIISEEAQAELAEIAARARESLRQLPKRREDESTANAMLRWSKRKQGLGLGYRQASCQDFGAGAPSRHPAVDRHCRYPHAPSKLPHAALTLSLFPRHSPPTRQQRG